MSPAARERPQTALKGPETGCDLEGDKRQDKTSDKPHDKADDKHHDKQRDKQGTGSTPPGCCPPAFPGRLLVLITLSAVALFGILTFVLIRSRYVGPLAALAVFLFGFFTADTGAATIVRALCDAVVGAVQSL